MRSNLLLCAAILTLWLPLTACSSNTEFETIQGKLDALELELLQIQKQGATGEELAELRQELETRIQPLLEGQEGMASELARLATRFDELEAKIDDSEFRFTQLSQQLAATNTKLDQLLAKTAARPFPAPTVPIQPPKLTDPRSLYDAAYSDYRRGNYDLAILGFREYLESSSEDAELADNATYWIGECFYKQRKFQLAVRQFDRLLARFERSDRVPSALLKKGYAYLEIGQRAQGVVQLQQVICDHQGTDEAQLASQRMQELGEVDVEC